MVTTEEIIEEDIAEQLGEDSAASAMEDEEFLSRFHELSLPPAQFGHAGHVRLAWLHLQRSSLEVALVSVCAGIRAYATHHGAPEKFHSTMTQAMMILMHARRAADTSLSYAAFRAQAPELGDARSWLAQYYSATLLASAAARAAFVPPDLRPLP